jgi:hypothetical protein
MENDEAHLMSLSKTHCGVPIGESVLERTGHRKIINRGPTAEYTWKEMEWLKEKNTDSSSASDMPNPSRN